MSCADKVRVLCKLRCVVSCADIHVAKFKCSAHTRHCTLQLCIHQFGNLDDLVIANRYSTVADGDLVTVWGYP